MMPSLTTIGIALLALGVVVTIAFEIFVAKLRGNTSLIRKNPPSSASWRASRPFPLAIEDLTHGKLPGQAPSSLFSLSGEASSLGDAASSEFAPVACCCSSSADSDAATF